MQTALTDFNNQLLDNKWNTLKNNFADYADFQSDSVEIGSTTYTLTDLWAKSADSSNPAGSTFADDAKEQLQDLVDNSIGWTTIKNELDEANDNKLDNLWNTLKLDTNLGGYTGFNPGDNDFTIRSNPYRIHLLIRNKGVATAGRSLDAPIKTQLQALVNNGVTASQVRSALDTANTANNTALNNLWTALKLDTNLGGYTGFNPGDNDFTIGNNPYRIHLLITNKELETAGSALTLAQGKTQLQALVNASVTASQVRAALNTANNEKLDDLWTAILALFKRREYDPETDVLIVKDKTYAFKILPFLTQERLSQKDSGSTLEDDAKKELQALVNDGITVQDIETYWNSVQKQKANEKKQEETKNKNLAIGLGTAGGVVALAGAGGFAYWFLKIRKS